MKYFAELKDITFISPIEINEEILSSDYNLVVSLDISIKGDDEVIYFDANICNAKYINQKKGLIGGGYIIVNDNIDNIDNLIKEVKQHIQLFSSISREMLWKELRKYFKWEYDNCW